MRDKEVLDYGCTKEKNFKIPQTKKTHSLEVEYS